MHTVQAHACAKLIIAGEHAVVYLRPALAVPLPDIRVTVHITAGQPVRHQGTARRFLGIRAFGVSHVGHNAEAPIAAYAHPCALG